jgi:hypothetical protein
MPIVHALAMSLSQNGKEHAKAKKILHPMRLHSMQQIILGFFFFEGREGVDPHQWCAGI